MSRLARDANAAPIQCLRHTTTEKVTVGGTAASSSAIVNRVVRVVADTDVFFNINSAATTSSCLLPQGAVEFIHTYTGDTISFITGGASGSVYVTEMI
tara:strand:- start:215 stop:508 length:294 start_codon:yes stop_codon:yes gene_type:complete